jgi:hypothetical protein
MLPEKGTACLLESAVALSVVRRREATEVRWFGERDRVRRVRCHCVELSIYVKELGDG